MRRKTSYNTTFTSGKYYLYRHIRLDKNEPFYIGIGTRQRGHNDKSIYLRAYTKANRSCFWKNIVNKTNYDIEIVYETSSVAEIKQKEIEFIEFYGRKESGGILCNMTDGGDGLNTSEASIKKRKKTMEENGEASKRAERLRQLNRDRVLNGFHGGAKKIFVYGIDGRFIQEFNSVKECGARIGLDKSNIIISVNNKRSTRNYIFSFIYLGETIDISKYEIISDKAANCAKTTVIVNTVTGEKNVCKSMKTAAVIMGMNGRGHVTRAVNKGFYKQYKVFLQ